MSNRKPIIIFLIILFVLLIVSTYGWNEGYLPGSSVKRVVPVDLSPETKQNFEEQAQKAEEKLKQASDDFDSWISLGIAKYQLGKLADAAFAYEEAGRIRPKNSLSFSNLGDVYVKMEKIRKARAAYERALDNNPNYESNYKKLVGFLEEYFSDSKEDIAAVFERGLKETEFNYTIASAYADWRERVGDLLLARDLWERLLNLNPGNPAIQDRIAKINEKLNAQK